MSNTRKYFLFFRSINRTFSPWVRDKIHAGTLSPGVGWVGGGRSEAKVGPFFCAKTCDAKISEKFLFAQMITNMLKHTLQQEFSRKSLHMSPISSLPCSWIINNPSLYCRHHVYPIPTTCSTYSNQTCCCTNV